MKTENTRLELRRLMAVGPEAWATRVDAGGAKYWAMLNGKPLDRELTLERIRNLRELYERAKADPSILKPMGLSLVELELGLIKNLKWLKAGGEEYEVKHKEDNSHGYEEMNKRLTRLHYTSARSRKGHVNRK